MGLVGLAQKVYNSLDLFNLGQNLFSAFDFVRDRITVFTDALFAHIRKLTVQLFY